MRSKSYSSRGLLWFYCKIKNVLGHTAKDVFATLNYSKMHITVNANKNTKLTPTALNIVYSPP